MTKSEAENLMELLLSIDKPINEATQITFDMDNEEEGKQMRMHLAKIVSEAFRSMMPIIKQYPDLDPNT